MLVYQEGHQQEMLLSGRRQEASRAIQAAGIGLRKTRSLSPEFIEHCRDRMFVIPMSSGMIRSLNPFTSISIVAFDAVRQFGTGSHSRQIRLDTLAKCDAERVGMEFSEIDFRYMTLLAQRRITP
jgi:hypothetical protein